LLKSKTWNWPKPMPPVALPMALRGKPKLENLSFLFKKCLIHSCKLFFDSI
jgi:hypothetical protein